MEGTKKSLSSFYSLSYCDRLPNYHVVAMEKLAEQHLLTKCSKCNTFQVISDLLHEFMINVLQLILKIHKNNS